MINERCERGSNLASIFVSKNANNRERTAAWSDASLTYVLCKHASCRLVVCDVEYPLDGPRNNLEPPREPDIAQRPRDCLLVQGVARIERFNRRQRSRRIPVLNRPHQRRRRQIV